jgi:hypothetical protein
MSARPLYREEINRPTTVAAVAMEWNGTPCAYEGVLVDAYYPLTALITGRLGRGVPIP